MSLRERLEKLERETEGFHQMLTLPDGRKVRYTQEELLDAMFAAIDEEEHRLLPYIRQIDTNQGMPGPRNGRRLSILCATTSMQRIKKSAAKGAIRGLRTANSTSEATMTRAFTRVVRLPNHAVIRPIISFLVPCG